MSAAWQKVVAAWQKVVAAWQKVVAAWFKVVAARFGNTLNVCSLAKSGRSPVLALAPKTRLQKMQKTVSANFFFKKNKKTKNHAFNLKTDSNSLFTVALSYSHIYLHGGAGA